MVSFEIRLAAAVVSRVLRAMNRKQRAQLIRSRFRAIGGLPYAPGSTTKNRAVAPLSTGKGSGKPMAVFYGVSMSHRMPDWLRTKDEPEKSLVAPKHSHGKTALTRIAEKWRYLEPLLPSRPERVGSGSVCL